MAALISFMNVQEFQAEINAQVDLMGGEVLLGVWNRIKELSDDDVGAYKALIDLYANFRIYHHRVKRWLDDSYDFSNITNRDYNRYMSLHRVCQHFFEDCKEKKLALRESLRSAGIDYRKFHPKVCYLDMNKISKYPSVFD